MGQHINKLDKKITHVITDPPFGIDHVSNFAVTKRGKELMRTVEGDEDATEACELFFEVMDGLIPHLADEVEFYIFTSWKVVECWKEVVACIQPGVVELKNMLVWDKGSPGLGDLDGNWAFSHELILYAKKGRRKCKDRRSSIIAVDRPSPLQIIHPMEKPEQLLEILINHTHKQPDDFVVDPFSGSGATLRACRNVGVDALGFEKDDEFYKKSHDRLFSVQTLAFT